MKTVKTIIMRDVRSATARSYILEYSCQGHIFGKEIVLSSGENAYGSPESRSKMGEIFPSVSLDSKAWRTWEKARLMLIANQPEFFRELQSLSHKYI